MIDNQERMVRDDDANRQREEDTRARTEERQRLVKGMRAGADDQVGQARQDEAQVESSKNMKKDMIARYKARLGDRANDIVLTGNESLEDLTSILETLKSR